MWALLGSLVLAEAAGGGGVMVEGLWMPHLGPDIQGIGVDASATAGCVGGQGFALLGMLRLGGEGRGCFGPVRGGSGGVQVGVLGNVGRMHLSAYTGVGGGSLHSQATGTLPYLYVQPTATVGWSAGRVGVEVGPYLRVPFYVLDDRGPVVVSASAPTVGGQVSLLFGNWNRRKATVAAPAPVVQPYPPAPPYAPAPPPPPRPPGGPLAIPGGAPPPLEGPR